MRTILPSQRNIISAGHIKYESPITSPCTNIDYVKWFLGLGAVLCFDKLAQTLPHWAVSKGCEPVFTLTVATATLYGLWKINPAVLWTVSTENTAGPEVLRYCRVQTTQSWQRTDLIEAFQKVLFMAIACTVLYCKVDAFHQKNDTVERIPRCAVFTMLREMRNHSSSPQ